MTDYFAPRADAPAAFALGTMNFGKRTPADEATRIIHRALDAGIGLLDTANAYNDGDSERIVGEAVRGRQALVATKVGFGRVGGKFEGLAPKRVLAACDESLERLRVEAIDLYYLHVPDHGVPIGDTLGALRTLLDAGKIRRWGLSNYASWQVMEIRALATAMGMPGPVVAQQIYNPLIRQLDIEWFKYARRFPIHTSVYNPLAGGILAGRLPLGADPPKGSRFDGNALYKRRYWRSGMFDAVDALRDVAAAEGVSLVGLAYGFALRTPGVDSVLIGPATEAQLQEALDSATIELSPEAFTRMREIYADLVGTDASYAR